MEPEKIARLVDAALLQRMGYGLEAIKRLRAGRTIIYGEGDVIVEEFPDGRRLQVGLDENHRRIVIGTLPPLRT